MGDIEREMIKQEQEAARRQERLTALREEGKANLGYFVTLMQAHRIGQTILYICRNELVKPPPVKRRFHQPVEQESFFKDTFSLAGKGWEIDICNEGNPQLHIILENSVAYRCRRPKPPKPVAPHLARDDRPDPPHLEKPYVVSDSPEPIDYMEFQGEIGLELLADAARKHIEAQA